MKTSIPVANALKSDIAVKALPELVVDWNMNRYIGAVSENMLTSLEIDNAFDAEYFPIESIVEPNRPSKGINKARVGSAVISDDYDPTPTGTTNPRYYVTDVLDQYKYWTSQTPSDPSTAALVNCKPQVIYNANVVVNKITIKLENTWASPATFNIQTTTSATPNDTTDWTTVANQTTTPSGWKGTGVINLFWDGTDWQQSLRVDNTDKTPRTTTIRGVRIVVTVLEGGWALDASGSTIATQYYDYISGVRTLETTTGKDSFFDLIEISARLEVDLSQYIIDMETDLDMGDSSNILPVGDVSTNQATIHLSNLYFSGGSWVTGLFSADNTDSVYHQYIDENAKLTGAWNYYDVSTDAFIDRVPEFVMYADNWGDQEEDSVELTCSDYSKFFNEGNVSKCLWENLTVPQIIFRLLDSVGFNNYNIDRDDTLVTEHVVPVFYTDGTQTVWQTLNDLATATQTAIYFDSAGILQVKTRDFIFSADAASVYTFRSTAGSGKIADIVSAEKTTTFEPNYYTVVYQQTNWSPDKKELPALQSVWTPDGDTVLRSTPLVRQLNTADTKFYIGADDVRLWPYSGIVNIQGELISFNGKEFVYYTGSTAATRNVEVITTQDEYNTRNAHTPWQYRHKNSFTGALIATERGKWNSDAKTHYVDANGYTVAHVINGSHATGVAGFNYLRKQSEVVLNHAKTMKDHKDILLVTRGSTSDTPYAYYGTSMTLNKGRPQNTAGMLINSQGGSNEDGYYIEIRPSLKVTGPLKKSGIGSATLYTRVGGKDKILDHSNPTIIMDRPYEIDATFTTSGSDHIVKVWVDGKLALNSTISGSDKNSANGRFGMFIRGKTKATYEYLYAVVNPGQDPPDDFSLLDKIKSAYTGRQWDKEWVYRWKTSTRRVKKWTHQTKHRIGSMFYDEFGPYVHELRQFDVTFDPAPVQFSKLYVTADWNCIALEYVADPFGASFMLANISRENAVINGDDSLSFKGSQQSIPQAVIVFGLALVVKDGANVIAQNVDQVRIRGKIEGELSSDWIQSEDMANDIVNWMNDNFSYGNDEVSLVVFGNPLIEIGDVVHVTYASKHMDDDYFVIGVQNSWDSGIVTTLTLRRRVTA